MNRLLVYLGHLFLILIAYAMAALAASSFMHIMWLGSLGWTAEEAPWITAGSIVFSIPFVALFVAYFAFVPAALMIGMGEILGARDWLFYAIGGAAIAVAVIALFWYSGPEPISFADGTPLPEPRREPLDDPRFAMMVVGAGIVAGIIYWALAGRFAGVARVNHKPG